MLTKIENTPIRSGYRKKWLLLLLVPAFLWQCKKDDFLGETKGICPEVVSTDAANNAKDVATTKILKVVFNEDMDPASLNASTFLLKEGTNLVSGNITSAGTTATFTPASNLAANTVYTGTITTGAKDPAGNALRVNYTWTFTTGAAPTVIATDPLDAAVDVALNKTVTATFSVAMDPSTITATTYLLKQGTTSVPGTVTYTGKTASFAPTGNLLPGTTYTGTITTGAIDSVGSPLASDYTWSFTTLAAAPPTVISTDPADGGTIVALAKTLSATFSRSMDPTTVNATTFLLKHGAVSVPGTVTYTGTTASFNPTVDLLPGTTYTGTITTGAKDPDNLALASDYTWSFTTVAVLAAVPPTVISTDPANQATNVALNKTVAATFSAAMDPATVTSSTFLVKTGAVSVAGTVTYTGTTASFNPTVDLLPGTTYTGTITTGAKDAAGNPLASNYTWTFTTRAALAAVPPTVISTDPANQATNVTLNKTVAATFSAAMDPATISATTFLLKNGAVSVAGVVTYTGTTASFNPTVDLLPGTTYTGTITTGTKDAAGTALANNYTWTFTTGLAPDNTPPTVISTDPANGATNVALNKTVTATFSELMDPLTISASTFLLKNGAVSVAGVVTYTGTTASFKPSVDLLSGTTYTGTITTGAKDAAGNALASNHVWTFTTAAPMGPEAIDLSCADRFAVLAGSTVTSTGLTVVDGDLGLSPGSAVTGFGPGQVVNGQIRINDELANNAKGCLTTAFNKARDLSLNMILVSDGELGGKTLAPGLYKSGISSFAITNADLTLDANGDINAVWIFQMPSSTLTVGNGRKVILTGGAQAKNIFWQVGTSATIGTTAVMKGNIMADQSITMKTGASIVGRLLTRIAAVSLDANTVTKP